MARKRHPHRPSGTAARQAHLLESAISVVGRAGLRGLTHRAVDREAQLPEGTCSVYFRTRLALLTALTTYVAERLTDDVKGMGDTLPLDGGDDPGPAIEATVEMVVSWSTHPELLITMTELFLESVRTPSLRPTSNAWREGLLTVVEGLLESRGKADARRRAQSIVGSVEGIAISALPMAPRERQVYLRETLGTVMASLTQRELV